MTPHAHTAVRQRNALLRETKWRLVRIFDTYQHDPHKDVSLVKDGTTLKILRIGERRPKNFFPHGYRGHSLIVPRLYAFRQKPPYELEEYLPGRLLAEVIGQPSARRLVPARWLARLMQGHWEFQTIAKNINGLPVAWSRHNNLEKYLQSAQPLLGGLLPAVKKIVARTPYQFFWRTAFPCKWKYAADNLIAMRGGKLGLIDNARIGLRYWGYDLGWIVWPRWFVLPDGELKKADQQWRFLEEFFQLAWRTAPQKEKKDKERFELKCALILFERLLGALYDIQENIPHAKKHIGTGARRRLFIRFLLLLLARDISFVRARTHL